MNRLFLIFLINVLYNHVALERIILSLFGEFYAQLQQFVLFCKQIFIKFRASTVVCYFYERDRFMQPVGQSGRWDPWMDWESRWDISPFHMHVKVLRP